MSKVDVYLENRKDQKREIEINDLIDSYEEWLQTEASDGMKWDDVMWGVERKINTFLSQKKIEGKKFVWDKDVTEKIWDGIIERNKKRK